MTPNQIDPPIDEIREIRRRISEQFDHDPERLVAHYIELQKKYAERLIRSVEAPPRNDQSAA